MERDLTHWESYYCGGSVVSCPMGRSDGYDLEVLDAWKEFFCGTPQNARIVDIATGNGAVALIAREAAKETGRNFEIHGVDLADIDPLRHVSDAVHRLAGVRFHPRTPAEQLPFGTGSIDVVVGQYALEYTDVQRALSEIGRVLSRPGRARFIVHHVSSIVVQKARATLALGEKALDQLRLLDLTRQYLRCERAEPSQALAIHAELSRRSAELRAAAAESIEPQFCDVTLQWLARAFELRKTETAAGALQSVEAIETALRAWLRRMNDLLTCAWGPQEVKQACELARSVGLAAGEAQLQFHNGTRLIGWRLDLQKPA